MHILTSSFLYLIFNQILQQSLQRFFTIWMVPAQNFLNQFSEHLAASGAATGGLHVLVVQT